MKKTSQSLNKHRILYLAIILNLAVAKVIPLCYVLDFKKEKKKWKKKKPRLHWLETWRKVSDSLLRIKIQCQLAYSKIEQWPLTRMWYDDGNSYQLLWAVDTLQVNKDLMHKFIHRVDVDLIEEQKKVKTRNGNGNFQRIFFLSMQSTDFFSSQLSPQQKKSVFSWHLKVFYTFCSFKILDKLFLHLISVSLFIIDIKYLNFWGETFSVLFIVH